MMLKLMLIAVLAAMPAFAADMDGDDMMHDDMDTTRGLHSMDIARLHASAMSRTMHRPSWRWQNGIQRGEVLRQKRWELWDTIDNYPGETNSVDSAWHEYFQMRDAIDGGLWRHQMMASDNELMRDTTPSGTSSTTTSTSTTTTTTTTGHQGHTDMQPGTSPADGSRGVESSPSAGSCASK